MLVQIIAPIVSMWYAINWLIMINLQIMILQTN